MGTVNFVKAMLAFQDYAAREALSTNEVVLFLALFRVMNDRRWPGGMQRITNNELLAHTTFYGSHRDDTLREARKRLAERGLIDFSAGDRRAKLPEYGIRWEALGIENEGRAETVPSFGPEIAPEIGPKNGAQKQEQNPIYNINPVTGDINKNAKEREARARQTLPNVEQVRAYCREIGLDINPLKFLDYCACRGYRDWRAALRIWKFRDEEEQRRAGGYRQRRYTEDELERRITEL